MATKSIQEKIKRCRSLWGKVVRLRDRFQALLSVPEVRIHKGLLTQFNTAYAELDKAAFRMFMQHEDLADEREKQRTVRQEKVRKAKKLSLKKKRGR